MEIEIEMGRGKKSGDLPSLAMLPSSGKIGAANFDL